MQASPRVYDQRQIVMIMTVPLVAYLIVTVTLLGMFGLDVR